MFASQCLSSLNAVSILTYRYVVNPSLDILLLYININDTPSRSDSDTIDAHPRRIWLIHSSPSTNAMTLGGNGIGGRSPHRNNGSKNGGINRQNGGKAAVKKGKY